MRKVILGMILGIIVLGMFGIVAAQDAQFRIHSDNASADDSNASDDLVVAPKVSARKMFQIFAGDYTSESGEKLRVLRERGEERIRLMVENFTAVSDLIVTPEVKAGRARLRTILSNGRDAEIKIMPDAAAERALERLRLRVCREENNCTIELREVGNNTQTRVAYRMIRQRNARVLGLFRRVMDVEADVDAETGDIIEVRRPWWAWLASEPEED